MQDNGKEVKSITEVITSIRESHPDIEILYLEGRCPQFALILTEIFKSKYETEIYYVPSQGHIYTRIENRYFDIRGRHFTLPEDASPISKEPKQYGRMDRWANSDHRRLLALVINYQGVTIDTYIEAAELGMRYISLRQKIESWFRRLLGK